MKDEQKNFTTPTLQPGVYVITMKGSATVPGGDADLYVRAGSAPTTATYDCRPYKSGSEEECQITLTSAKKIYIAVRGYASAGSPFTLTGRQQQTGGGSG